MQIFKCDHVAYKLTADQSAQLQQIDLCCMHRHKEQFVSLQSRLYFNSNFQGDPNYKSCLYWYINIQFNANPFCFAFAVDMYIRI